MQVRRIVDQLKEEKIVENEKRRPRRLEGREVGWGKEEEKNKKTTRKRQITLKRRSIRKKRMGGSRS